MKEDSFVEDNIGLVIAFIIIFLFVAFVGLMMWKGSEEMKESTKIEGYEVIRYTKTCIDNKEFILRLKGLTINLDMDGKPIPCNLKE